MKYAFYPGCVSRGAAPELFKSTIEVCKRLDIELEYEPMRSASCTGSGILQEKNLRLADTLNARTFALAERTGLPLINICSTCQGVMSQANERLKADPEYLESINQDLSEEVWSYIFDNGFLGIIIPKEFSGLGFSHFAHATIVGKLSSASQFLGIAVMVPNSLGPGELLLKYGTEKQKQHYLPRLAKGQEIPCFGLTSTVAGSDAGSLEDNGIVCYGDYEGEKVLGLRLNWEKRYITLAPIATVIGLAFKAYDQIGRASCRERV